MAIVAGESVRDSRRIYILSELARLPPALDEFPFGGRTAVAAAYRAARNCRDFCVRPATHHAFTKRGLLGNSLQVRRMNGTAYEAANLFGWNKILREVLRTRFRSARKFGAHDAEEALPHGIENA